VWEGVINMQTASSTTAAMANFGTEESFGNERNTLRWFVAVMRVAHELWPEKTEANLAARTGRSTRTCELWSQRYRALTARKPTNKNAGCAMDAESFVALLSSEDGLQFLNAVMAAMPAKHRPRWFVRQSNAARLAALESAALEQDQEIRQLRLEMSSK
jgi:chemotaxis response regulator CheB